MLVRAEKTGHDGLITIVTGQIEQALTLPHQRNGLRIEKKPPVPSAKRRGKHVIGRRAPRRKKA
jgi:hypothetical protein